MGRGIARAACCGAVAGLALALALAVACGGGAHGGRDRTGPRRTPARGRIAPATIAVSVHWRAALSAPVPARIAGVPRLALDPAGDGLIGVQGRAYAYSDCRRRDGTGAFVMALGHDGRIGPVRALRADLAAGPVALGHGRFAALLAVPLPRTSDCGPGAQLVLADLDGDGRVTARRIVARRIEQLWTASAAAAPRGALAAAWTEVADETTFRLRVLLRSPSGAVTGPFDLARGDGIAPQEPAVDGIDVAFSPDGAALVAYAERGRARLATIRPDATVARRRTLGPTVGSAVEIAVAAGRRGRTAVVWGSQDGGEERGEPYVVRAAVKAAGARFAPAQTLDRGAARSDPPGGLAIGIAADGSAVVAWDQTTGFEREVARYAIAPPDGAFGRARRLARGAGVADLAVRPDGAAIAVVARRDDVLAVRRRSATAAAFGVAEIPAGDRPYGADAAFDQSGRPLLAWTRPAGDTTSTLLVARRG